MGFFDFVKNTMHTMRHELASAYHTAIKPAFSWTGSVVKKVYADATKPAIHWSSGVASFFDRHG